MCVCMCVGVCVCVSLAVWDSGRLGLVVCERESISGRSQLRCGWVCVCVCEREYLRQITAQMWVGVGVCA